MVVQVFLPFCRLPFRFVDCPFCCAEMFKCDVAPRVVFFFSSLFVLLVSYAKIISKSNVERLPPYISLLGI